MVTNIIIFIIAYILGALTIWIYNQVTDKMKIAKAGYGIGKTLLLYIIGKFKK